MANFGKLIGNPFLALIDANGTNTEKEKCAFVVRDYFVPNGYKAYLLSTYFPEEYAKNLAEYCPNASVLYNIPNITQFGNYDIVDVDKNGNGRIVYQDCSEDNVLFITNKCNSNCIMCPDSDTLRKADLGFRKDYLAQLIDLIPSDTRHLTITGGEPTLLKWDLIDILRMCRERFPHTIFLMLSNGRSLADDKYRSAFLETIPDNFSLAIPLYGTSSEEHDQITRATGSFKQTIYAIKSLAQKLSIEIRIVVMQKTLQRLPQIARFLVSELPHVHSVSIMGMELMGNAAVNRTDLWVDFQETIPYIEEAVQILFHGGIETRIYNYPLCLLPRSLWSIAAKSISGYKVRYLEDCNKCTVKNLCGGFFFSTLHLADIKVKPFSEE